MSKTIGLLYPIKEKESEIQESKNKIEPTPEKVEAKKKTTRKPKAEGGR